MSGEWTVIYTKSREEKWAQMNLEQQGHEVYSPKILIERLRQGKRVDVVEPLFPRYIFVRIDTSRSGLSWGRLKNTRGVIKPVTFGMDYESGRVCQQLVEGLREREATDGVHRMRQSRVTLKEGDKVVINNALMDGVEAIFKSYAGANRVALMVNMLGKKSLMTTTEESITLS
jgi:transcriptional antiterminator RfaH